MAADMKRRLARGVAVITIALGAGHLVQSMSEKPMAARNASNQPANTQLLEQPKHIERLAATDMAVALPVKKIAVAMLPKATDAAKLQLTVMAPKPASPVTMVMPVSVQPSHIDATVPAVPLKTGSDPCPVALNLASSENALIEVNLLSPCHASERVVVKHAGLTFTAKTSPKGALLTDLPALVQNAEVEVMFKDNTSVSAKVLVPELASLRRFAVQWQQDDAFQLHAFEDTSEFGGAGDVSASMPHAPATGVPAKGGFMTVLGDASTTLPMLAQVYTYPKNTTTKPEILIEAAVTKATCGREMLGQTLLTTAGAVKISDMSLEMPDCNAVGDYLVLKNLVPDMTIASAN
ncbi:MAG: hypothetical protein JWS10_1659 [Cypionkella sp.]|uniref:hypothetical protein n=1 Tax=Cypionkella sp. TaxID=2811411 RepID=UPI00263A05F6|nr:hypothetical protein [Cypionkella sp.]MDB5659044.1 hypothetical protein [Cypionkella sp.]